MSEGPTNGKIEKNYNKNIMRKRKGQMIRNIPEANNRELIHPMQRLILEGKEESKGTYKI